MNHAGSIRRQEVLGVPAGRAAAGFQGSKLGDRAGRLERIHIAKLGVALEPVPLGLTGPAIKRRQPECARPR
ncbi:hypothetical protein [Candidatus Spongiihabitans sp.]|uniref:hypothetical protein n=1 Tax=Candidatus Spongiihabitans sp. TaxID=3101308 RepID=UPI003C7CB2E0